MDDTLIAQTARQRSFHTLDGLRGVAAVAVALFHYRDYAGPLTPESAYLAVDLFFAISGFVLARAYTARLRTGLTPGRFVAMRIVRLYPLYLLGLGIALVVPLAALATGKAMNWTWGTLAAAAVPNLLFLPSPPVPGRRDALYQFNSPAWSLFYELVVNALFAATVRWQRRLAPALVAAAAPLVVLAAAANGSLDAGWRWSGLWIGLVRVVFSFFLGVVAHRLYAEGRLRAPRCPAWAVLALLALLLWPAPQGTARVLYDSACVLVLLPALLWLGIGNEPGRGARTCATLGIVSFPLYAIHSAVMNLALDPVNRFAHGRASAAAPWIGLIVLAALAGASVMLARTYDVRARAWLGRRLGVGAPRVP